MAAVRGWLGLALACAALVESAPARADLLTPYAQFDLGGVAGAGIAGAQKRRAFQRKVDGIATGFTLGVEALLVDIFVQHHQYIGWHGFAGTLTKFMAGFDTQIGIGPRRDAIVDEQGYLRGGRHDFFLDFGGNLGFGLATQKQIDLPIDNEQLSDKGLLAEFGFGAGYNLNRYVSVGARIPLEFGFMVKKGVISDSDNFYAAFRVGLMLNIQAHYQVK